MKVLQELLEWSVDRPAWQRDALRRLVVAGDVSADDLRALVELCKSAHGLAEQQAFDPLAKDHVPDKAAGAPPVSVLSIFHHRGVNALAEGQTLKFGPRLTVVYGDNAAGKTGYIRILKSACRARGRESILGNVVSGATPLGPVVAIRYQVGGEAAPREWSGKGQDELISRVSVFDAQSASVYLTEKTDVAFRPFGLDLFDKLVRTCKAVRSTLEGEQRGLASDGLASVRGEILQGTAASKLVSGISSLTKPEAVLSLSRLSVEEEARLLLLEKSLLDLQAEDPEKLARQLAARAGRMRTLAKHLKSVEAALGAELVEAVFGARARGRRKGEEAKRLRELAFPASRLAGAGSDEWKELWNAARRFSEAAAYPGMKFPVVDGDAACVLCQQHLEQDASERLVQFETFAGSGAERELREIREEFSRRRRTLLDLAVVTESSAEAIAEIRIEREPLADSLAAALAANEARRKEVLLALSEDRDLAADCPPLVSAAPEVEDFADQTDERARALRSKTTDQARRALTAEAQELRARRVLGLHEKTVLEEIERKKRYAAYGLCLEDTRTNAITQKSTAVTKVVVSQKLKESFRSELERLSFRDVEVELREVGGAEGVLYHKLALTRAPGVELPRVVSEGEQRCLAIAAFFAELSTADDPAGIVFDDPVSSLDYKWREAVARRLVEEAATRQVIVFTHDVVFLLLLKQFAEERSVDQVDQHVRHLSRGAGVCAEELPWVALKVSKRIGHLRKLLQNAEKLFGEGHQDAYDREASVIYGYLREAWERGLEEVLLGGVVGAITRSCGSTPT